MTERSYTAAELVGLPGMPPRSERSVYLFAEQRGMVRVLGARPARWLHSSLPDETRAALAAKEHPAEPARPAPFEPRTEQTQPAVRRPISERAEAMADARLDIVQSFERWRSRHGTSVLFDDQRAFAASYKARSIEVSPQTRRLIDSLSRNTLDRWQRRLRQHGWSGLVPQWGGHNAGSQIDRDGDIRDAIVAHILERPGHVNAKYVMRALRLAFAPERLPSYRTLQRWVSAWRRDNARLVSAVADPDRHRSKYQPAAGDAGAGITRANQLWELDSTPADVICTDGRHAVVGAIDVATRRLKVLVVPTSKAVAIAALLRRTILAWGVPETVRTDEGADYTSRHIRRALADLRVEHDVLPPFSPERKPFIERALQTLSHGLFERLPGFCGHDVAEGQALRNRKSFAARRGEDDRAAFQVAMSSAELQAACDSWLETVYEREPHQGLNGRSPFAAAAGQPVRTIADDPAASERTLDVLLAEPADGGGWRTVQKKGLKVDGAWFIAPELGELVGEGVSVKRDPADYGGVYVFDRRGGFVCRAVAPDREGLDRAAVAAAMREAARKADAEARAYARELKRQVKPEHAIRAMIDAGRAEEHRVVAFPAPTSAHDSPGVAAAAAAAASQEPETRDARRQAEEDEAAELIARGEAMEAEMIDLAAQRRRARDEESDRLLAKMQALEAALAHLPPDEADRLIARGEAEAYIARMNRQDEA